MSILKVNTFQNSNGVEVYTCKAWVNFNGTGTVAIRASGNVSSITDNGVGDYTVNFATAMADANYIMTSATTHVFGTGGVMVANNDATTARTTSNIRVWARTPTQANVDAAIIELAIFR